MIRRLLLVSLRWVSFQVGYGLEMGRTEAAARLRGSALPVPPGGLKL